MKNAIILIGAIALVGGSLYVANNLSKEESDEAIENESVVSEEEMMDDKEISDDEKMMDDGGVTMDKDSNMTDKETMSKGSYEEYSPEKISMANDGNLVLFFRASWCPSCRALDTNLKNQVSNIPEGLTILDVDYDQYSELKKKYGVTTQHTLVQVDAEGNLIQKWSGGNNLDSILRKITS